MPTLVPVDHDPFAEENAARQSGDMDALIKYDMANQKADTANRQFQNGLTAFSIPGQIAGGIASIPFRAMQAAADYQPGNRSPENVAAADRLVGASMDTAGLGVGAGAALPAMRDVAGVGVRSIFNLPTDVLTKSAGERSIGPIAAKLSQLPPEHLAKIDDFLAGQQIDKMIPLAEGRESVVMDAGNRIVRIGQGRLPATPKLPEVLQPVAETALGGIRVQVMPKVRTDNITEADAAMLKERLRQKGFVWGDPMARNVGRLPDGRLVVFDGWVQASPYALRRGEPQLSLQDQLPKLTPVDHDPFASAPDYKGIQ